MHVRVTEIADDREVTQDVVPYVAHDMSYLERRQRVHSQLQVLDLGNQVLDGWLCLALELCLLVFR